MSRRAVLLQLPGDPFVGAYWFRNFGRVYRGFVDELHVFVNGQQDAAIVEFLRDQAAAVKPDFLNFWHREGRLVHGQATRELVQRCAADTVMLIEDDAFVREAGAIDEAFTMIETGAADVIGTPRGGMDPEIERFARAKWQDHDLQSPHGADSGPGLWPCFVFSKLDTLKRTSMRFESWCWQPGDVIPGLGYEVRDREQTTDSFTTTAFELRGAGLRITPCVQHKELWDKQLPVEGAPWFHAGGLSNGDFLGGAFGELGGGGARPGLGGSNEGLDWAHRIWWWRRCVTTAGPKLLPHLQGRYHARLDELTHYMGVAAEVEQWTPVLEPWINWDDQA